MSTPSALVIALAAWMITTLIILVLEAIDRRRQARIHRLLDALFLQAQDAVTRHQWARGTMGTSQDWATFNRTMENLAAVVQSLEQEHTDA